MPLDFKRELHVSRLKHVDVWDIIIIGGGATGLGVALDAASRGYSTLLLEQSDFAKATSGRSTKLVHGGVRYLAQGNIKLVYTALHEREILFRNAAHLIKRQSFIIPCFNLLTRLKYFIGLKIYDLLAGSFSFGRSKVLNVKQVKQLLPGINYKNLKGGIEYFDGQFDDARLAVNLAQTCSEHGATVINYCRVTGLLKVNNKICGVSFLDNESKQHYELNAKVVVNATGVFVDDILKMDKPERKPLVKPSQGTHIVFPNSFLNGSSALMIPKTSDGRVLFAIPWYGHLLVGTTDTPLNNSSLEPKALKKEIHFIIETLEKYWINAPGEKDILSVFAGLRPLAAPQKNTGSTKEISRDHKLLVSASGLVTITGGKWTTYRKMAEETMDAAIKAGNLKPVICLTKNIKIHGCSNTESKNHLSIYGSDEENIKQLIKENPFFGNKLIDKLPYTVAEVIWAVRNEMARTIEDVLARRIRILFLDAKAAIEAAPEVAEIMAEELNYNEDWKTSQLNDFRILAEGYLAGVD
ncbi:MAG: glycerol-3-phosphate dehydrogenase/oxidase [Ginsengibacter sp.]